MGLYMDALLEMYGGFPMVALFRMFLALVCGTIVGVERQLKGRFVAVGCKTFCMVCLGSALAMITNEYLVRSNNGTGDLARMAAQVISGIGFLGAGTIMTTGSNKVRGLASASSLWVTASLGIAIGAGFYMGAVGGVVLILFSTVFCNMLQNFVNSRSQVMRIQLECETEDFMQRLNEYIANKQFRIMSITRHSENKWYKKDICVILEIDLQKRQLHQEIVEEIRKLDGVRYVQEV